MWRANVVPTSVIWPWNISGQYWHAADSNNSRCWADVDPTYIHCQPQQHSSNIAPLDILTSRPTWNFDVAPTHNSRHLNYVGQMFTQPDWINVAFNIDPTQINWQFLDVAPMGEIIWRANFGLTLYSYLTLEICRAIIGTLHDSSHCWANVDPMCMEC